MLELQDSTQGNPLAEDTGQNKLKLVIVTIGSLKLVQEACGDSAEHRGPAVRLLFVLYLFLLYSQYSSCVLKV